MAREFARIKTNIGDNPDWTNLPSAAQALYITCLSHPTLTSAGVLDWRPRRLATRAADWTPETINTLGHQLEANGFLIIDQDAEYAFIRSFHRHDPFIRQSDRIGTNIATAITAVESPYIKDHIAAELWRLREDHPEYRGFKSPDLQEFMSHRTDPKPNPHTPPDNPTNDPGDSPSDHPLETPVEPQPTPQPRDPVKTPTETPIQNHPDSMPEEKKTRRLEEEKKKTMSESAPPPRTTDPDPFDEFWDLVPRKVKKPAARKAFAAAVKRADGGAQAVIDGMRRYAADPNLPDPRGPEANFIMHPATWLRGDCWDDPALPGRSGAGKSARGASGGRTAAPGDYLSILRGEDSSPESGQGAVHAVAEIVSLDRREIS
ncbi:hypothetical protein [Corynebacterium sp.]|uniref:hypothetical protein n=1 Tax=Corynebacterium sp. TaxID=1720 RepID=UPI0028B1478F|nr:hypothetical protein [Corynebacterium sp.]